MGVSVPSIYSLSLPLSHPFHPEWWNVLAFCTNKSEVVIRLELPIGCFCVITSSHLYAGELSIPLISIQNVDELYDPIYFTED